jgi:DNA-binding NarL/FixJ family response regulator
VRAALVDDATVIRSALPDLLRRLEIVSVHPSVEHLLADAATVDLVVLDLHLVNRTQPTARQGIAAIRAAVDAGHRVCVYSQEERRWVLAACLAAGARGSVSKAEPVEVAEQAFLDVAAGDMVVPPSVIGLMEVLVRRRSITLLSERQRQVLAGRARGLTYAEMSQRMHLSESTLRGYWHDLATSVSEHLQHTAPADIERALGLAPGDLLDTWPQPQS